MFQLEAAHLTLPFCIMSSLCAVLARTEHSEHRPHLPVVTRSQGDLNPDDAISTQLPAKWIYHHWGHILSMSRSVEFDWKLLGSLHIFGTMRHNTWLSLRYPKTAFTEYVIFHTDIMSHSVPDFGFEGLKYVVAGSWKYLRLLACVIRGCTYIISAATYNKPGSVKMLTNAYLRRVNWKAYVLWKSLNEEISQHKPSLCMTSKVWNIHKNPYIESEKVSPMGCRG